MDLEIEMSLKKRFPGLMVLTRDIRNVKIKKQNLKLEKFKIEIINQARDRYNPNSLKDLTTFRAYRDFFWRVGIDPTKNRPAAEALIRRVLGGKNIPCINSLVDAYNLASIKTEIDFAAFDAKKIKGSLSVRFAEKGEKILGIGMKKTMLLRGGEIVISDNERLVAIYPYRDSDYSKITEETRNVILLVCGVPAITEEDLQKAAHLALEYIIRFCDGDCVS